MTTETEYPLFLLPEDLGLKGRYNWDAREAREYREWLLGTMDDRVEGLLRFFDEPRDPSPPDHLARLGEKIAPLLRTEPFCEILERPVMLTLRAGGKDREVVHKAAGERELADAGWSLAVDMGLLFAQYLQEAFPNARWRTVRKPRNHIDYNLPVLEGILSYAGVEPIGISEVVARRIMRDASGPDEWKQTYEYYLEGCPP